MKRWLSDPWMQALGALALVSGALTAAGGSGLRLSLGALRPAGGRARVLVRPDGTGDAATLEAGLALVETGGELSLSSGTYRESVVVDRPVKIAGAGRGATVIAAAAGPALSVRGGLVELSGASLSAGVGDGPVLAVEGGSITLRGCAVSGGSVGALVQGRGSVVRAVDTLFSRSATGVSAADGADVQLERSQVSNAAGTGLSVTAASLTALDSSVSRAGAFGLYADRKSLVSLDRSPVSFSGRDGVRLGHSSVVVLNGSRVERSQGAAFAVTQGSELHLLGVDASDSGRCGLEVYDGSSAFVEKSSFPGNRCGVGFFGGGRLTSENSDFTANAQGAFLYDDAAKSAIFLRGQGNQPPDFQELFR